MRSSFVCASYFAATVYDSWGVVIICVLWNGVAKILIKGKQMKECTLQEAVELCKNNGGFFYKKDATYAMHTVNTDEKFTVDDILMVWIYEPPQSAFNKWLAKISDGGALPDKWRNEGWNAAIDEVIKYFGAKANPSFIEKILDGIKELKEP